MLLSESCQIDSPFNLYPPWSSPSFEVMVFGRLAARDLRSTTGSNLASLRMETGLDPWLYGGQRLRDSLMARHTAMFPVGEEWRIKYIQSLLSA